MAEGVPERIGPYEVQREIGRGGMGVVYLARDTKLDRDVAIKALPDALAADPERLARFEREAKLLASPKGWSIIRQRAISWTPPPPSPARARRCPASFWARLDT